MVRYVTYAEIEDAISGMPIELKLSELEKISRQTLSKLKLIRLAGRRSAAQWRADDLQAWFARRYKNAPELVAEFEARLNAPRSTADKKPTKARAS